MRPLTPIGSFTFLVQAAELTLVFGGIAVFGFALTINPGDSRREFQGALRGYVPRVIGLGIILAICMQLSFGLAILFSLFGGRYVSGRVELVWTTVSRQFTR